MKVIKWTDDKKKNLYLLIIYARIVSEITIVIGFVIVILILIMNAVGG